MRKEDRKVIMGKNIWWGEGRIIAGAGKTNKINQRKVQVVERSGYHCLVVFSGLLFLQNLFIEMNKMDRQG